MRAYFTRDGRKPGFFGLDKVSHRGANGPGGFCSALTLTGVCSGRVEVRGLRNRAHLKVKLAVTDARHTLPFAILGINGDNGGEFINSQLKSYRDGERIRFTRSGPCRKNDSRFAGRKNGDIVRKPAGYFRYDTDAETAAPREVYKYPCPFVNFRYPSIKIVGKARLENGRYKKDYDLSKTPCRRLPESPYPPAGAKNELRRRAALVNPVALKRLENRVPAKLLKLNREKNITNPASGSLEASG